MAVTKDSIIQELEKHGVSEKKVKEVSDAYDIAEDIHDGVPRQSGEPYITHPLNVANNLLNWEIYDADSISAALLHDTLEDAKDEDEYNVDTIKEKRTKATRFCLFFSAYLQ